MTKTGWIADRLMTVNTRWTVRRRLARLDPRGTLRDEIEEWTAEHGDRPALAGLAGDERLRYRDLAGHAARWARWAILHGIARGESVALVLAARPERFAAVLGLAQVGAIPTLPATVDAGPYLAATLDRIAARHVVVDSRRLDRFEAAAPHLTIPAAVWVHGEHPMAYPRLDEALDALSPERLRPADRRPLTARDPALAVATPEATTRLDHRGALRAVHAAAAACRVQADDRLLVVEPARLDPEAILAPGLALSVGAPAWVGDALAATAPTTLIAADPVTLAAPLETRAPRLFLLLDGGEPVVAPTGRESLRWGGGRIASATGTEIWTDDPASRIRIDASFATMR